MANYNAYVTTNNFTVTDEEKYQKLYKGLISEDLYYASYKDEEGVLHHGFASYGSVDYYHEDDEDYEEPDFDEFVNGLQKILPEDETFILYEVGHEKLRYVCGYAIVVTKTDYEVIDLENTAKEMAKKLIQKQKADKGGDGAC